MKKLPIEEDNLQDNNNTEVRLEIEDVPKWEATFIPNQHPNWYRLANGLAEVIRENWVSVFSPLFVDEDKIYIGRALYRLMLALNEEAKKESNALVSPVEILSTAEQLVLENVAIENTCRDIERKWVPSGLGSGYKVYLSSNSNNNVAQAVLRVAERHNLLEHLKEGRGVEFTLPWPRPWQTKSSDYLD